MVLENKELVKCSAVYVLLHVLMKNKNFKGRRIIKKIMMSLKKNVIISKDNYDKDEWLYYVELGEKVIVEANNNMVLKEADFRNSIVSPNIVLNRMFDRESFCKDFNIPIRDLEDLDKIYSDTNSAFTSLIFTNRLKDAIENVELYKK